MINNRKIHVGFVDDNLKKAFDELLSDKTTETDLYKFILRAISDLKENPFVGIKIPSKVWSKEYIREYKITNLYKYDLPNGWRLIYTVKGNQLEILSLIIEWFDHKDYERRFKY